MLILNGIIKMKGRVGMSFLKNYKEKKYMKEIQPLVDEELIKMGLLKIEDGKKQYSMGSSHVSSQIIKRLMKEKYNYDWESPEEKNPGMMID